jgi:hypothetical protein
MNHRQVIRLSKAELRFFAGLLTNLSAAWFAAVMVAPVLTNEISFIVINLGLGLTSAWIAIKIEEKYESV